MNSRLHFKISTSSFQTKLFCLCTRALRGNRLHRPFRARGDQGHFSPFSPRPPTPGVPNTPHHPLAFHSTSPPNLLRQLPPTRSTAEPSPAPPCSPRPCARSSASSLPPLSFQTHGGLHPAVFICSPATLEHIDAVTLASPVVRPGLH